MIAALLLSCTSRTDQNRCRFRFAALIIQALLWFETTPTTKTVVVHRSDKRLINELIASRRRITYHYRPIVVARSLLITGRQTNWFAKES